MEFEVGQIVEDENEFIKAGWEKIGENWGTEYETVFQKRIRAMSTLIFWSPRNKKISHLKSYQQTQPKTQLNITTTNPFPLET